MTQLDGELADVRIRPYGLRDANALRHMSRTLTARSLYQRFFAGTPAIPEQYVRAMQNLDHWDHDALAAFYDGELVGLAEYVRRRDDGRHAEFAILVTDPWQRRGLGSCLTALLGDLARGRGITWFEADVLLENRASQSLIRRGWPWATPAFAEGAAHYELPIPAG